MMIKAFGKKRRLLFLTVGLALPAFCFAQDQASFSGVVPEILKRPNRETEWAYPVDAAIGQLGKGEESDAANAYARAVLRDLIRGNTEADSLKDIDSGQLDEAIKKLGEIEPRKSRLGGGRDEIDGSVSFLFRFIGRENGLSGELYIRAEDGNWKTEDIIVGDVQKLNREGGDFTTVYTPYERFY
jgi:hypothetical protein